MISSQIITPPYYGYDGATLGFSPETDTIQKEIENVFSQVTPSVTKETLAQKFTILSSTWKTDTQLFSTIQKDLTHNAYLKIISLGKEVLPYIFSDLADSSYHWFPALKIITGVDPVSTKDRGDMEKMKKTWLEWGKKYGYIA